MNNNSKLHYRYNMIYPAIILLLAIILLITVKWGAIPELERLISFGLTLTSLFLSLIAIVFAIFSNFSFSKSSTSLEEASTKISGITTQLNKATTGIEERILQFPNLIAGLGESFKEGHQKILEKLSAQEVLPQTRIPGKIQDEVIQSFLKRASYSGLTTLYACKLSKDKNIWFSLDDLNIGGDYSYGFLVACSALGLVEYEKPKDKIRTVKINSIIDESIENVVEKRIKYKVEKKPQLFKLELEQKKLQKLRDYFIQTR